MTNTLDPSHKQIEMWRRATGSEGGLDEYRNWVLENSMRFTAYGIHTVIVEGEAKHITALDDVTLCNEWAKLKRENNRLYAANGRKNLLWLAWFCVAFVRNNTVMQKTGHLTGGRREESK
ncbi:hypothetical protein ACLB1R_35165 [Escherichia coli]